MDSLLEGIHKKLCEDLRIRQEGYRVYIGSTTIHSVRSCSYVGCCRIRFHECGGTAVCCGAKRQMDIYSKSACERCADILSDSLPPVKTFLQRRELVNILTVKDSADGCFYCYRRTKRVTKVNKMCARCDRAHKQEEDGLVKKKMILGEVLGADCAGVVAGYMLYFLQGALVAKLNRAHV